MRDSTIDSVLRTQLREFLIGGFAPSVELLKEFDHKKAAIILDGLHFSAWILLGHIKNRQQNLLKFLRDPESHKAVWEEAVWPENYRPESEQEWNIAIDEFARELDEMIAIVEDSETDLFRIRSNGKTISWAVLATLHHNSYHIGQLKAIGRQLGVW